MAADWSIINKNAATNQGTPQHRESFPKSGREKFHT